MPPRVSLALRVTGLEAAFARHWLRRGWGSADDKGDAAVREILTSLGAWEEWTDKYGEDGASRRYAAYKKALFQLVGEETWIVFGDGGEGKITEGTAENPSDIALLLFMREDAAIKSRIGPLANLLLPGHQIASTQYRGHEIFEYAAEGDRRSITLARIGGWVCASMRSEGRGPIERTIDRHLEFQRAGTSGTPIFEPGTGGPSVLEGVAFPNLLWAHLDAFAVRREKDVSKASRGAMSKWAERLRDIDEITIRQSGGSLLNLDLTLRGPRIAELADILIDSAEVPTEPMSPGAPTEAGLAPPILQFDMTQTFAVKGLPLFGIDVEDFVEDLDDLRWFAPRIGRKLGAVMLDEDEREAKADADPEAETRFGVAMFAAERSAIPALAFWQDAAPWLASPASPADAWRLKDDARRAAAGSAPGTATGTAAKTDEADTFLISGRIAGQVAESMNGDSRTTSTLAAAERALADSVWAGAGRLPLAYLAINFDEVGRWMDGFPMLFLGKNDRRRWAKYRNIVGALETATGSLALRLDRVDDELTLSIRTLEVR